MGVFIGPIYGSTSEEQAVGAIWIDSSYADVQSILERNWEVESGLPQPFLYSTIWMPRVLYGNDIAASRPIDEIATIAPRPIFIAHCQKDLMIPISNMDQLLTVAQNTQTWKIPYCSQKSIGRENVPERYNDHAVGYLVQPEEYSQKVIRFFNESLK